MGGSYEYGLFGWHVRCAFPLPELVLWQGETDSPDVVIDVGPVPPTLDGGQPFGPAVLIGADRRVRLTIPTVASYLVESGDRVVIEPFMPIDAPDIRVFLLGTVLSILCFRRGLLPLHASAVEVAGHALLLAGESGIGKSTLAAVLAARGYRLLADDLCAVAFPAEGQPLIYPAFPRLKLWADAANHLSLDTKGLERSRSQLQKFHVPLQMEGFGSAPIPPARIVLLREHGVHAALRTRRLLGLDAMRQRHIIHRWRLGAALGCEAAMFTGFSRLLAAAPLIELTRRSDLEAIEALADRVMTLPEPI